MTKQEAIEILTEMRDWNDYITQSDALQMAIDALAEWHDDAITNRLNNLPSAQPEIIRCKDCRYNNDCEIQYGAQSGDEFFCGCAERRSDG